MEINWLKKEIENKKVLFITTKNLDYLRNTQEAGILKNCAESCRVIGSFHKQYAVRLIKVFWNLLFTKGKQYDVVFIGFAPQLILPFWYWKFKNNFIIIDFFISMYDTLIWDRKKWKDHSVFARFFKYLDKKTLDQSDLIISDTVAHGDYFSSEFSISRDKINTLYLCADQKIYYPRKKQDWGDKYQVLYFGSILPLQGIEIILQAVKLLQNQEDISFVLIGPIGDQEKGKFSKNITFYDWLPQKKLAELIAEADLCLAGHFCDTIEKAKRTIPGKAYIYEAMNKKMILGDGAANHELFQEDANHFFVKMGDPHALAEKIMDLKQRYFFRKKNEK